MCDELKALIDVIGGDIEGEIAICDWESAKK